MTVFIPSFTALNFKLGHFLLFPPLVKAPQLHYFPRMSFYKYLVLSAVFFCGLGAAFADTIQLKGNDAVTGKILIEKPDAVVVDVGYTVLVVPRSAIIKISQANSALTR